MSRHHGMVSVGKRERLVRETTRTSAVRAAGVGAGTGLLALGVPRLRMVSRGLSQAAERAVDLGRPDIANALKNVEILRREAVQGGGHIVRRLPGTLRRPVTQVGGGALLVNASLPVTQRTYRRVTDM